MDKILKQMGLSILLFKVSKTRYFKLMISMENFLFLMYDTINAEYVSKRRYIEVYEHV